jgi:hypothetical protein
MAGACFFVDFCDVLGSGVDLHRRGVKAAPDWLSGAPGPLISGVGKGNPSRQMSYDIVPYRKITSQDIGRDISQRATLEPPVSFAGGWSDGRHFGISVEMPSSMQGRCTKAWTLPMDLSQPIWMADLRSMGLAGPCQKTPFSKHQNHPKPQYAPIRFSCLQTKTSREFTDVAPP